MSSSARRASCLAWLLAAPLLASSSAPGAEDLQALAPVLPGQPLQFPRDFGSHPQFGVEWWYVTGWLANSAQQPLGFQITFFRIRSRLEEPNPSAFAARQLLIAHAAISDPTRGHAWQDQRIRRGGFGLAEAREGDTDVRIDDWRLARLADQFEAHVVADDFGLDLALTQTQPPLLNGQAGFSRKGPAPESASYYYSMPQLRVRGTIVRAGHRDAVEGSAWLDHEWSSAPLPDGALGWDWVGLNLSDGGAIMAFRIRGNGPAPLWAGATLRDPHGQVTALAPEQVLFRPGRSWHSPRTGVLYPVQWALRLGQRELALEPLMDDQEIDTRASSGTIYWEGAVRVRESGAPIGRGYLELTGYERPVSLR